MVRCVNCQTRTIMKPNEPIKAHQYADPSCIHEWKQTNNKVRLIDGVPHRKRRGRWVAIPPEWFGHKLDKQTKNKRAANDTVSKRSRKHS
jgi:hypothetical protein